MAAKKRLSAADGDIVAVWFAPETLRAEALNVAVAAGASAQEIADLAQSPMQGEYRESLGEELIEGVVTTKFGDRLVWVHPEGADNGWYERFEGEDDAYVPVVTPTAEEA